MSLSVEFRGVTVQAGRTTILHGVDLRVAGGQRLAVVGPSGSGKSTLLRLVMGLQAPSEGHIEVDGRRLPARGPRASPFARTPPWELAMRRSIGMVFQQFNLFPHMSVMGNIIEAPIRAAGLSRRAAVDRAGELLALVGLADKADVSPGQLSGGQQQRVAIARALALDPKVLLLDEITSSLDPELVGEVLGVVRRLGAEQNLTMLMVTHHMAFAREFADRVVVLSEGRIVDDGTPDEVFIQRRHPRTRQFLQSIQA